MKDNNEAVALTKFEKGIKSVLERDYETYKSYIGKAGVINEFDALSKKKLKAEIKKEFDIFVKDLGYNFNITDESIEELKSSISSLEEDKNRSKEKDKLLTSSKALMYQIEAFDKKLDSLCDDFFEKAQKEPELSKSKSFNVFVSAIVGAGVGLIAGIAASLTATAALCVAMGPPAIALFPVILPIFSIVGITAGATVGIGNELLKPKKEQQEAHLKGIAGFSERITESAETLKTLIKIRQENIKLEGASAAGPQEKESAVDQLKNSHKSPQIGRSE